MEPDEQSNLPDIMQGYLFSRPLPADEFKTLLHRPAQAMPS